MIPIKSTTTYGNRWTIVAIEMDKLKMDSKNEIYLELVNHDSGLGSFVDIDDETTVGFGGCW